MLWMMPERTRFRKLSCRSLVGSRRESTMADDYTIERTRSGFQYLIPGTERRTLPKCAKPEHSREGDQYVIPGAEPITTRELLSRLAGKRSSRAARNRASRAPGCFNPPARNG